MICPPRAHLVFITPCRLVAMGSDKRSLNSITKNTPATLGSLLKTHLSMSSSHVVNRNSCVPQCLLVLGTGLVHFQGSLSDPPKPGLSLFPLFLKPEIGRCAGTDGNLGAPGVKHKSRRQLNSVLQDAALIMEQFCSFMRFSSVHLTTWSRLCWAPPPLPFFHILVSAFNLAFCSDLQKTGGTVGAKKAKHMRESGVARKCLYGMAVGLILEVWEGEEGSGVSHR